MVCGIGQTVYGYGERSGGVYIVLNGYVDIYARLDSENISTGKKPICTDRAVQRAMPGDMFGEREYLMHIARHTRAVVMSDACTLLPLDNNILDRWKYIYPYFYVQLKRYAQGKQAFQEGILQGGKIGKEGTGATGGEQKEKKGKSVHGGEGEPKGGEIGDIDRVICDLYVENMGRKSMLYTDRNRYTLGKLTKRQLMDKYKLKRRGSKDDVANEIIKSVRGDKSVLLQTLRGDSELFKSSRDQIKTGRYKDSMSGICDKSELKSRINKTSADPRIFSSRMSKGSFEDLDQSSRNQLSTTYSRWADRPMSRKDNKLVIHSKSPRLDTTLIMNSPFKQTSARLLTSLTSNSQERTDTQPVPKPTLKRILHCSLLRKDPRLDLSSLINPPSINPSPRPLVLIPLISSRKNSKDRDIVIPPLKIEKVDEGKKKR